MAEIGNLSATSDVFDRIRNEKAPLSEFTIGAEGREVTLDEARSDLAAAVGAIAHMLFSRSYGPLVGTVATTSVETLLKNAEKSAARAKGDVKLVAEELSARICKSTKK